MSENKRLPKSDFGKSVGDDVVLYLAEVDSLKPLDLPHEDGRLKARLVGVDRPGVWIEPKAWYEKSVEADESVRHVFLKWDNVLGLTRDLDADLFGAKKEYRGLRPRS
ncbi:MAG: hypothetical protein KC800_18760 [Candidatus Eremiobacteraeota bacterium]|nr:hypothetical protein [Candidatus Eremiobacteraeota bacterium]